MKKLILILTTAIMVSSCGGSGNYNYVIYDNRGIVYECNFYNDLEAWAYSHGWAVILLYRLFVIEREREGTPNFFGLERSGGQGSTQLTQLYFSLSHNTPVARVYKT